MKHNAISYRFTMKELQYILFKKKSCPICGNKMKREKNYKTCRGSELNTGSDPFFVPNANVKSYEFQYVCKICKKEYKLNQLI